jgi:hypothetical protein
MVETAGFPHEAPSRSATTERMVPTPAKPASAAAVLLIAI